MNQQKQTKQEKRLYTYQDIIKFSDLSIYSGFGEIKQSKKPSAPKYSFGTSTRDAQPKKFYSKQMATIDCYGKQTPKGPNYNPSDKFMYNKSPEYKIGTEPRNTLDVNNKYDHYFRKDIDFDTNQADKIRRVQSKNIRFGGASRFPVEQKKYKMTPGPQYNPIKPQTHTPPQFSIYARRAIKGYDPLVQTSSTSQIVGPGAYHPENSANTSGKNNFPAWSVPKGPRDPTHLNRWQLGQTYDNTSSIGTQPKSQKPTKPLYSIGKQMKGQTKSGIFSAHMEYRPMQVRIDHPRF